MSTADSVLLSGCDTHAFIGWLDRVLLLMPLQINIIINCYGGISVDMPDLVFSCACLQHLSMSLYTHVKIIIRPVSINLPSLKFLELNYVELPDDFSQKLFMGCPSLERLKLHSCDLYFSGISSQVLKELTLHFCDLHEQMQISCPNLVFMRIHLERGDISLKNMSSLVDIVIIIYQDLGSAEVPVLNFFGCLSNVVKLKLHLETLVLKEQLEKDISNCRNFNNLKKLVVAGKWDMSHDFYLIACLLKHSPNLKKLRLLLLNESQCETQEAPQEVSGGVLFRHEYLETVKIGHMYMGKLSSELIDAMIKLLVSYVKKIGSVIIT